MNKVVNKTVELSTLFYNFEADVTQLLGNNPAELTMQGILFSNNNTKSCVQEINTVTSLMWCVIAPNPQSLF